MIEPAGYSGAQGLVVVPFFCPQSQANKHSKVKDQISSLFLIKFVHKLFGLVDDEITIMVGKQLRKFG
jgi:hypothetical protein